MSDHISWSKPRATPMAGRRKATLTWCDVCECLHRTHRHPLGEELCMPKLEAKQVNRDILFSGPNIMTKSRSS